MVNLQTSLLAVTLATGSVVLALPTDFQRREQDLVARQLPGSAADLLRSRGLSDEENLFARSLNPHPFRDGINTVKTEIGANVANRVNNFLARDPNGPQFAMQSQRMYRRRDLEDSDDLFGRDLDVEDLEVRGNFGTDAYNAAMGAVKQDAYRKATQVFGPQRRELEDDDLFGRDSEDFFERDLEAELD